MSRAASSVTQAVTILSGQSVNSRVYTSRFGNGTVRLEPLLEVVLKKVPGTVPSGKPPKSEPYCAAPCHGKAPLVVTPHDILESVIIIIFLRESY